MWALKIRIPLDETATGHVGQEDTAPFRVILDPDHNVGKKLNVSEYCTSTIISEEASDRRWNTMNAVEEERQKQETMHRKDRRRRDQKNRGKQSVSSPPFNIVYSHV